jgi:hypothetical protein
MTLTLKTNHADEIVENLANQFHGKPRLAALLTVFAGQVQELEQALYDLLIYRQLEFAEGAQVDGFGSIVGEAREGRTDIDYKAAIRARINLNLCNGTAEDIINLIRGIVGDVRVKVTDYYPAGFIADIVDPIDPLLVDPIRAASFVQSGKPAGVRAIATFSVPGAFKFDSGPGFDLGKYGGAI